MEGGDGEQEAPRPLVGFLFGNVDVNNKVEADYLDEVRELRAKFARQSSAWGVRSPSLCLARCRMPRNTCRAWPGCRAVAWTFR